MKEKKIVKKRKINRILTILMLACIVLFYTTIFYLGAIPIGYVIISLLIVLLIVFFTIRLNFRKKKRLRVIGYIISIIIIGLTSFTEIYLYNTLGFLFSITGKNYTIKTYNVLVLDSSNYQNLDDITNKNVGISETSKCDSLDSAQNKIKKSVTINYKEYNDITSLVESLTDEEIEAIILEESELNLLKDEDGKNYNNLRSIYKVEIKQSMKELASMLNINKEPFNIYISGIDTYGNINSTSRSDVNMILTVNPKTEKILITWIPRDYYVKINKGNYKDKLTHTGIYGVDSSIYALEDLLDIDINYYVKVNFTSVEKVIKLLGDIEVDNETAFTADNGTHFKEGNISLNGEKALTFVRERHHVKGGDVGRGKHQVQVLEAIIKKAMSPKIIEKYNSLLNSLDGAFVTNMSKNTMMAFIRKEISSRRNWQIDSITLTGKDGADYTYSYKKSKLYVMYPDEEVLNDAKKQIKEVIKPKETNKK